MNEKTLVEHTILEQSNEPVYAPTHTNIVTIVVVAGVIITLS